VTVWQNFDKTNANVEIEASYLADLYRDAEAFSPDFRIKVVGLLREYRNAIVNNEWKDMAKGELSPKAEKLMREIWFLYTAYHPRNITEQVFFNESVSKLNSFRDLRRKRLMDSSAGIPSFLWFVLIVEGMITIAFLFLFGVENFKAQIVMGVLFSAAISLILLTVLSFDFPFTGDIGLSPKAFQQLLLD
jgi:hypothetical protein